MAVKVESPARSLSLRFLFHSTILIFRITIVNTGSVSDLRISCSAARVPIH